MTGGCENKHVDSVAGRILATAWTLVGTGLIALFTGSLAATLTAERIGGAIRGPADLARREIGTEPGIGPDAIRARGGIPLEFNSLDDVFSAADRGLVEALVSENLSLKSALARPGRGPYRVVGPVFDSFDAGIVLKPGSDLREPLNTAILAMREDGTLADMFDRWLGGGE